MTVSILKPDENNWVETLNGMGYMSLSFDPYTQAFLDSCASNPGIRVFEGGAAYGQACLAALEVGAFVTANDSDGRHLSLLEQRTPPELRRNLILKEGRLPDKVECPAESFESILCSRMLHFLRGEEIQQCLAKFYQWLKRGGRAYLVAETPYLGCYASFIPTYEDRKRKNVPWPGFLEDTSRFSQIRYNNIPSFLHFLDPDILTELCRRVGFVIEKAGFIDRSDFPPDLRLDGRESVGIVAKKS